MARRMHVMLSDRQHAFLVDEAARTGLPIAELLRRAVDRTYRPYGRERVPGIELSVGIWRRPDAAAVGRRPWRRLPP